MLTANILIFFIFLSNSVSGSFYDHYPVDPLKENDDDEKYFFPEFEITLKRCFEIEEGGDEVEKSSSPFNDNLLDFDDYNVFYSSEFKSDNNFNQNTNEEIDEEIKQEIDQDDESKLHEQTIIPIPTVVINPHPHPNSKFLPIERKYYENNKIIRNRLKTIFKSQHPNVSLTKRYKDFKLLNWPKKVNILKKRWTLYEMNLIENILDDCVFVPKHEGFDYETIQMDY